MYKLSKIPTTIIAPKLIKEKEVILILKKLVRDKVLYSYLVTEIKSLISKLILSSTFIKEVSTGFKFLKNISIILCLNSA
jgi:hypothetical protein